MRRHRPLKSKPSNSRTKSELPPGSSSLACESNVPVADDEVTIKTFHRSVPTTIHCSMSGGSPLNSAEGVQPEPTSKILSPSKPPHKPPGPVSIAIKTTSGRADCEEGRDKDDDPIGQFIANVNAIEANLGPNISTHEVVGDPVPLDQSVDCARAQIDTGAQASCCGKDALPFLHNFRFYTPEDPPPIGLGAALEDANAVPVGVGYLHVPATNSPGYYPIETYYHPDLRTTLINEKGLIAAAGFKMKEMRGEKWSVNYDTGRFTLVFEHKLRKSCDVVLHGVLRNDNKYYTAPLIPAGTDDAIAQLKSDDPEFAKACTTATICNIYAHQEKEYEKLREDFRDNLPRMFHGLPFHEYIQNNTPVNAIRKQTERLLWHQRLGHPSDTYLFDAHRHIKGVPTFKHMEPILDMCPTCIRAKQTKEPAGPNSTRTAEQPFQGLSIDFSFAGQKSADGNPEEYVGLNGETCWILMTDHFSRMKFGDTRVSKASPLQWIEGFLKKYAPVCRDKYVVLDQGGELYANPKVRDLFEQYGYELRPTGADASRQNGPVERGHRTVTNGIRSLLAGANLHVKFWPYAFHHFLRLNNSMPSRDQTQAPLKIAQNIVDDLSGLRTFGCRVWVRPPGQRKQKFHLPSRKGIFLGFLLRTTRNILWYDPETARVKIATHVRFDEGMNDLPMEDIPPNVMHLQRSEFGNEMPMEESEVTIPRFEVGSSPFFHTVNKTLRNTCRGQAFGFSVEEDELNGRAYVSDIRPGSSASKLYSSMKATKNKLRGSYIVKINGQPVFTVQEVLPALRTLRDDKTRRFDIEFALEKKQTARDLRRAVRELKVGKDAPRAIREASLFAPEVPQDMEHVHSLCLEDLRSIAGIRFPHDDFSVAQVSTSMATIAVNAIRSKATTEAEQALGSFTHRKLKTFDTWPDWEAGERKQLDQFYDLQMYGLPERRPPNAVVLRQHWQYHIKRDGTRRARNCCDGSPQAAPVLHRLVQTYSSCVEQPVQRLFFALAAEQNYKVYGGDAKDAYAHSPPPERPTYVAIDDAYADWHYHRFGKHVDWSKVLRVQHALQGHPESGRLWEQHINGILLSPSFGFTTTMHDKSIYRGEFAGTTVFLLRQVDDFALAAPSETIAKAIYDRIGAALKLPSETKVPFSYLGLLADFNGVNVHQYSDRIVLSCGSYIDRVLRSHGWDTPSPSNADPHKPQSPLPGDCIPIMYATEGYREDSEEHRKLVDKYGFSYHTLLGELLYAYVTCRPDIGYAVITLSKFSTCPGDYHFAMLKAVAKYLRRTRNWGIHFLRSCHDHSLPTCPLEPLKSDASLPPFPALEPGTRLTCFLDAAHANDLRKRRSTTGYALMMAGGCVSYKCKTQPLTATSSTEAEFYASVSAGKQLIYLRAILSELGFPQDRPTPMYCDNQSAINMINARIPTERSRHLLIQFFAIQDWKERGDLVMRHIPGIINPSDDLTKPLGWILHSRHSRRLMGHYADSTHPD